MLVGVEQVVRARAVEPAPKLDDRALDAAHGDGAERLGTPLPSQLRRLRVRPLRHYLRAAAVERPVVHLYVAARVDVAYRPLVARAPVQVELLVVAVVVASEDQPRVVGLRPAGDVCGEDLVEVEDKLVHAAALDGGDGKEGPRLVRGRPLVVGEHDVGASLEAAGASKLHDQRVLAALRVNEGQLVQRECLALDGHGVARVGCDPPLVAAGAVRVHLDVPTRRRLLAVDGLAREAAENLPRAARARPHAEHLRVGLRLREHADVRAVPAVAVDHVEVERRVRAVDDVVVAVDEVSQRSLPPFG